MMSTRAVRIALLTAALCSCSMFRPAARPSVPDEEARHRAALATVVVLNQTAHTLKISYRTATPPLQEVLLGAVPARARQSLPPVPAGEPLFLLARRDDGTELALGPRSFTIDQSWTWEIPVDATFKK